MTGPAWIAYSSEISTIADDRTKRIINRQRMEAAMWQATAIAVTLREWARCRVLVIRPPAASTA